VNDQKNLKDLRFGSFRIDSETWDVFGKDDIRIKGVGVIPVRILKHIIDSKPAIVRGSDEAVLGILSHYSKSDKEQQQNAFMKYISTLRRAMGRDEFDALFPNISKSRDLEKGMGGYRFVGSISLANEPEPQESNCEEGISPQPITEDTGEFGSQRGITVADPGLSDSVRSKESSPTLRPEFELVVDGIIINSVSELIYDDPATTAIRKACSASYERSLADLAFAIVYANRLVTGKDFGASLTIRNQPGQELAARLREICEQRAYPSEITDGHLLRDEETRNGIREDMRRFSQCMADRRNTEYFRDFMLREGTKHLGIDDSVFKEDKAPGDYKFDVVRPFYTNRQLQDGLGRATDMLMSFLPKTPPNSTDRYATNALREFVTRNVLTHITIMWEGEEYARGARARRAPHVLRSLVTMKRSDDLAGTQHQEIVRDLAVEHALTTALSGRHERNRHNIVGFLLGLRDDHPFKEIRELLNKHHLILIEADREKEIAAQIVLKQLKTLIASSTRPDNVHLGPDTAIRAIGDYGTQGYKYQLYRVFPELKPKRG